MIRAYLKIRAHPMFPAIHPPETAQLLPETSEHARPLEVSDLSSLFTRLVHLRLESTFYRKVAHRGLARSN